MHELEAGGVTKTPHVHSEAHLSNPEEETPQSLEVLGMGRDGLPSSELHRALLSLALEKLRCSRPSAQSCK